jgi:hypothetical protein
MTTSSFKTPTTKKALCAKCSGERNCDIKGEHKLTEDFDDVHYWTNWFILECRGCNHVFFMRSNANSDDLIESRDDSGDRGYEPVERRYFWPALSKREAPEWVESFFGNSRDYDNIYLALTELYVALNNDLMMLSAIGVRTCFDVAAILLKVDEHLTFASKVSKLTELGAIGIVDEDRLKILIDAGGASAHRGWIPNPDELTTQVDLLEHFLQNAFVLPAEKIKLDKKASALKAKVPPRRTKNKTTVKIVSTK